MRRRTRSLTVRKTCQRLLREHRVVQPPVPIVQLAKAEGVRVVQTDELSDDLSGFLDRRNETPMIVVNAGHHPVRKRFTIAHELGHFLLHEVDVQCRDEMASRGIDVDEIEANRFAAEILMPQELVDNWIHKAPDGATDGEIVTFLASAFFVSRAAMSIRLAQLGYGDIAALFNSGAPDT